MKTHIIQLESHDDVYSTTDKMAWGKSSQILLVIPLDNSHFQKKLDFMLLKRKADQLGARLGIVTTDSYRRNLASDLSISWFGSIKSAQHKTWNVENSSINKRVYDQNPLPVKDLQTQIEKIKLPDLENSWIRIIVFSIAIISVITLLALLLPRATIILQPQQRIQIENLSLAGSVSPEIRDAIPIQKLNLEVQYQEKIRTSGSVNIPATKATGSIQVENISQTNWEIPAGTEIFSKTLPMISFLTVRSVRVGVNGGKVEIPVEARFAGSGGNRSAGDLASIEGELNTNFIVTNLEPTSGGSDSIVRGVAQFDYDELKVKMVTEMKSMAIELAYTQLPEKAMLLSDSISLESTVSEILLPQVNQPGDQLSLTLIAHFSFFYINSNDMNSIAQSYLDNKIPDGWTKKANSLYIENVTSSQNPGNSMSRSINLRAAQLLIPIVNESGLMQAVAGKTKMAAKEIIKRQVSLITDPSIKIIPGIWQWLPILPVNIEMSVQ